MLFHGAVPNTYAAGRATLAIWAKRTKPQPVADEIKGDIAECECGRKRAKAKLACTRCAALDADQSLADVMVEIMQRFERTDEEFTVPQLIEETSYRFQQNTIHRACSRLTNEGLLVRRRQSPAAGGHYYRRARP